ncbi:D-amino acid dehydrogenase [Acetobacter orientalis]|uniref:Amino acid dehydrogenase n=1 Tax=Acetobacter orientalis TaxID=146474 RepID=A0A252A5Y7_9PROT|nr:D-amino acid dehydrogenase [Acetobacter orientalis]OUI84995.1 amino acid dehydrogenase [Acetobacter orientalis]BBC81216.1 D-amino acid dehydrogenase small subunit [Acetobacter orientalis]GAN66800.1 D-amino acid dehydrogenase small subunit [Acetobacter orientalis]GBR20761.1 D-amino acid dehydrogenase small subunit [Acetobacter orientalis NRIC 0481]GEL60537.1 D-amino acid dehydrogenase [Acetobacter orientalis]
MKVLVLGAGVIGTTSAWYLAKLGHEVTVIDRQPAPGLETSFANAGQVSPGYSSPWASPALPRLALKWMLQHNASPLVIRKRFDLAMFRFIQQVLKNCNAHAYSINKARMLRVADYSRDCLDTLREEIGLTYDDRQRGLIHLFRTDKQLDKARQDMKLLAESNIEHQLLTVPQILAREPGLTHAQGLLKAGLYLPGDQSGDAHIFTQRLAKRAEALGVKFLYNTTIKGLDATVDEVVSVRTSAGHFRAESYIVSMGSYSPLLLKPLGLRLPIYPVKGYSLTIPLTDETHAPLSTVNDESYKVAITRLGNRIRVGGTAELAGYSQRLSPDRRAGLELSFSELFGGGDLASAKYWTGLRPCTPDGTPIIGAAPGFKNLWLNTGHGTLGWTMACGSGRLIADLVHGRKTDIPALDLTLGRYTP